MKGPSTTHGKWHQSLQTRAVLLLSLALLPIGIIAFLQSRSTAENAAVSAQAAVLALTERAAASERLVIEQAAGAAKLLAVMEPILRGGTDICKQRLSDFIEANPRFSFAGIIPLSGVMTCSSTGNTFDFSERPGFDASMAARAPSVTMNRNGAQSRQSVIIIAEPYQKDGEFGGYVSVSVPHKNLVDDGTKDRSLGLKDILTFNNLGDVLTSKNNLDLADETLPSSTELSNLIKQQNTTFADTNKTGQDRIYSIVPIREGSLYVLGIWDPKASPNMQIKKWLSLGMLPILMWLVSLAVAGLAIHYLVTRHVHSLGVQMTRFTNNRTFQPDQQRRSKSTELREIDDAFSKMAASIISDERALEAAVADKNILIKDMHHRVKNNLQLISSIINMQIRETRDPDAIEGLRAIQERVFNMAVIRHDYLSDDPTAQTKASDLITDVVQKNHTVLAALNTEKLKLNLDVDSIRLGPDQTITFSLLLAELASQAVRSISPNGGTMNVSFENDDSDYSILRITTPESKSAAPKPSHNLNEQLIKAFVIQLGATLTTRRDGQLNITTLTFKPTQQLNQIVNY